MWANFGSLSGGVRDAQKIVNEKPPRRIRTKTMIKIQASVLMSQSMLCELFLCRAT